ncbi:LLM class F420-dependent oxidoreductase [Candidatus Binatia bacterium]|nr:LLM class F420-dependent oxidoreductase [Candidatus Binatia bacterium]
MRIGLMLGDNTAPRDSLERHIARVQEAERDGFATAWFAQTFGMDAMTFAAVVGRVTTRIELGTAVVPTYPRHPVAMAQQALTAQIMTGGRFALGIGLSHQVVIETMYGLSFAKPYSHMKEYLAVLAPLIRSGSVSFAGREYTVNAPLTITGATPCPILLAALAPRMLALAGSIGDGTITWMTGFRTLREHTIPRLTAAATEAGRPAPRVVVGLPVAVTNDVKGARESATKAFQVYGSLPSYRAMLDREGAEGPADVAIVGDEAEVGARLEELAALGVTDFLGGLFGMRAEPDAMVERTWAFLAERARRAAA